MVEVSGNGAAVAGDAASECFEAGEGGNDCVEL